MQATIAVVGGTGAEGSALAQRFALAGAQLRIGSRNVERARAVAARITGTATASKAEGFENADAVKEAGVVVLTVPPEAQIDTLESLRSSFQPGPYSWTRRFD